METENDKHTQGNTLPDILEPILVIATDSPKSQLPEIELPLGYVMLIALNADGTDKEGTEFFYPERSYQKYYGDTTKYRVKKKLN